MPGFDGTGPRGEGPMTGGSRGYCAIGRIAPRWNRWYGYGVGRGGIPWGGGRGRAWGGGRGRWWRGYAPCAYEPWVPPVSVEDEKAYLRDSLKDLQDEMNAMKARLEELEKKEGG